MRTLLVLGCLLVFGLGGQGRAQELEMVTDARMQPLKVNLGRLLQGLDYIGQPLPYAREEVMPKGLIDLQKLIDPLCLASVTINPESRVSADPGPARPILVDDGWVCYLIKVINQAGVTAPLKAYSQEPEIEVDMFIDRPVSPRLSGVTLEYRILMIRASEPGQLSTVLTFDIGQGTQDVGFRSDLLMTFNAREVVDLVLKPLDVDGSPTTAAFEIRDEKGRSWPAQVKRVEPDFRFHPQVYRHHGESVQLPAGEYTIKVSRGPEYLPLVKQVIVGESGGEAEFPLERWIDPAARGWWSGDHHIHAAGCKHYTSPSEGVHAEAMMRHCLGEDLKVGANLTWGPCFDYQKQFFTGKVDKVSRYPYLLRYDVEVSGFGSHRSGHLCLLRLSKQIYPGGDSSDHWPTLCLNTLKWAQRQGAVCGPAHSGWGLNLETDDLPNYQIPPFDGIGANEYIVDVTHMVKGPDGSPTPAVDFLSMVDTPSVWELNIWYHTLNCGYRTRISGETDFPCIYGERVGLGRSYIKLDGRLNYDAWCQGIADGRGYVSDGNSHLMDMTVNGLELGTQGSEVAIAKGEGITVKAAVAARLTGAREVRERGLAEKPFWHIERARIGDTEEVKVELIMNGFPVAEKIIIADGSMNDLVFDNVPVEQSSWVALRIFPSSHTNPVFVHVDGKPIRASRKSAQWCLESVEQCWSQKEKQIAPAEMSDAIAAYDHARAAYREILAESVAE